MNKLKFAFSDFANNSNRNYDCPGIKVDVPFKHDPVAFDLEMKHSHFLVLLVIGQSLSFPDYSFGPSNGNFQSFYPGDHDPSNLQEQEVEPIHDQHSYFEDEDLAMDEMKFQPTPEEDSGVDLRHHEHLNSFGDEKVDKSKSSFFSDKKADIDTYFPIFLGYLPYLPGLPNPWNMLTSQPEPDMEAKLKELKAELVSWI